MLPQDVEQKVHIKLINFNPESYYSSVNCRECDQKRSETPSMLAEFTH